MPSLAQSARSSTLSPRWPERAISCARAREKRGRHHVGGLVDEIAREAGGRGPDLPRPQPGLGSGLAPSLGLAHGQRLEALRALLLEVLVEAVGAEHRAFHGRLRASPRRTPSRPPGTPRRSARRGRGRGARRPKRRGARPRRRCRLFGAEPGDEHARGAQAAVGVDMADLADLALELLRRQDLGQAGRPASCRRPPARERASFRPE